MGAAKAILRKKWGKEKLTPKRQKGGGGGKEKRKKKST